MRALEQSQFSHTFDGESDLTFPLDPQMFPRSMPDMVTESELKAHLRRLTDRELWDLISDLEAEASKDKEKGKAA